MEVEGMIILEWISRQWFEGYGLESYGLRYGTATLVKSGSYKMLLAERLQASDEINSVSYIVLLP